MFFASLSMISATIIRRDIIKPNLPHAYMGISDAYPQLVSILRSIKQRPLLTYSVNRDLMTHTPSTTPGYYFGDLEWCSSWFRMSRFLEDRKLRQIFVHEVVSYMGRNRPGKFNEFIGVAKIALYYKALGVKPMAVFAVHACLRLRLARESGRRDSPIQHASEAGRDPAEEGLSVSRRQARQRPGFDRSRL